MVKVPESAFPDPIVRAAAQAIADGDNKEAVLKAASEEKIDYVGPDNDSLLVMAVMTNDIRRVQLVLDLNANPNLPEGRAPLAIASGGASLDIVNALLRAGADPSGKTGSQSGLWRAAEGGRMEVAKVLLETGAPIDQPDSNGDTPMSIAVQGREYEMGMYLLNAGASPFAHDTRGRTVGFWADFARLNPTSAKGAERDRFVAALKDRGHPWPPPSGEEVLAMKAAGKWPPSSAR